MKKILLVDDDPDANLSLSILLRDIEDLMLTHLPLLQML